MEISENSCSENEFFGNNFEDLFENPTEDEMMIKQIERDSKRKELSSQFKNCYNGSLTKEQKAEIKVSKRKSKRKVYRENLRKKRKEILASMTEEEREKHADQIKIDRVQMEERLQQGLIDGAIVCVDCGFEDQMNVKELKSLAHQMNFIYGRIKKSPIKYNYHIINHTGAIAKISEERKHPCWKATFKSESLFELLKSNYFGEKEVIYLSPDADEELTEFKSENVYVIGGLVDATVSLNHTRKKANELGLKMAKLPIEDIRKKVGFRPCLNVNTVFYIIDEYFQVKDMQNAIISNLPGRFLTGRTKAVRRKEKLMKMNEDLSEENEDEEEEEEEENEESDENNE